MKKRILHVIDYMGPGGAQTLMRKYFDHEIHNKEIVLFSLRQNADRLPVNHEQVLTSRSRRRYSTIPLLEIRDIILKYNVEIIHCHLFRSQVFGWVIKKLFFPNIKIIFHEHGQILQNDWYYDLAFKWLIPDLWIAVSVVAESALRKKLNVEKLIVVHNFICLKNYTSTEKHLLREDFRKYLNISKDDFLMGFIGRLAKVKGCEDALYVLKRLDSRYKLALVGSGVMLDKLQSLAKKLSISDRVYFLGYKPNVQDVLYGIDLILVPSRSESFGLIALEAQAACVPVVASDILGFKNLLHDEVDCLLYPSGKVDQIEKKVRLISSNDSVARTLKKNGLINSRRFQISQFVDALDKIHNTL